MTLALLAVLALATMLLPMLPALLEWHRPTDVEPLGIDGADALDPAFSAHGFSAGLAQASKNGDTHLGTSALAWLTQADAAAPWLLQPEERALGTTQRIWHVDGDAQLPAGLAFLAETAAVGSLATARGGLYRALLAGRHLALAADSVVLRWAHAADIDVAAGCHLAGRATAEREIVVHQEVRFSRLHAPTVRFVADEDAAVSTAAPASSVEVLPVGLDAPSVIWDADQRRGFCDSPLDIAEHRAWRGDLVCRGRLTLGRGCRARGSLKAHGELLLTRGCSINGSLVATGPIRLGGGCRVRGSVISETAVVIGPGCVIGAPGQPATVSAPRIRVAPGAVVHGTLWASIAGRTAVPAALTRAFAPTEWPATEWPATALLPEVVA